AISGEPDPQTGMIVDLGQFERSIADVQQMLDHKLLNRIETLGAPTLENLARFIWERVQHVGRVKRVTVYRDSREEACSYFGQGPGLRTRCRQLLWGGWRMRKQSTPREAPLDEPALVELARGRDGEAIRIIVRRYNRRLYRVARGVLGNDSEAEDVVQETYVRAFRKLYRFRGASVSSTWLSRS